MTQLRDQLRDHPDTGLPLNPDADRPPFAVWMSLPASWSLLDTNPGTWRRSAEELLDTTFRGSRLPAAERKTFLGFVEGLVADCQSAGACISLITVGRREGGGAASAGIHIAFGDDGVPATLGHVQDSVPRAGTRTEIDSGVGPALLQRERMTMLVPGTAELAALTSLQIFAPIPDTTWTVALATASAYPELTDRLQALLVEIAASISTDVVSGTDSGPGTNSGRRTDPGPRTNSGPGTTSGSGGDSEHADGHADDEHDAPADRDRRSGPQITDSFDGRVTGRLGPEPEDDDG